MTTAQMAWALLWRSLGGDKFTVEARKILFSTLTTEEKREAIRWVHEHYGPMTSNEMIAADIRCGIFPRKSGDGA